MCISESPRDWYDIGVYYDAELEKGGGGVTSPGGI